MRYPKIQHTLLSATAATSIMTAFSYLTSVVRHQNMTPPVLLSEMFEEKMNDHALAKTTGWATHYGLGISWAALMELVFSKAGFKRNLTNSMISGTLSGLTGVAIWKLLFSRCPRQLTPGSVCSTNI